jgi:hypothetical protein
LSKVQKETNTRKTKLRDLVESALNGEADAMRADIDFIIIKVHITEEMIADD